MPLSVTPPPRFYKWNGTSLVETSAEDPNRFVLKGEAEAAIQERVFVSAFLGVASAILMRRLFARSRGR